MGAWLKHARVPTTRLSPAGVSASWTKLADHQKRGPSAPNRRVALKTCRCVCKAARYQFLAVLLSGRAALKRHVKAVDDNLRIERFFEDGDGTRGFGAFANTGCRKRGNE